MFSRPLIGTPGRKSPSRNYEFTPIGRAGTASTKPQPPLHQPSPAFSAFEADRTMDDTLDTINGFESRNFSTRATSAPHGFSQALGGEDQGADADRCHRLENENYNLKIKLATLNRFVQATPAEQRQMAEQNVELKQRLLEMSRESDKENSPRGGSPERAANAAKIASLEAELDMVLGDLEALSDAAAALEEENRREQAERERLQAEREQMRAEREGLEREAEQMRADKNQRSAERDHMVRELRQLEETITRLERKNAELNRLLEVSPGTHEVLVLQLEVEDFRRRIAEAEQDAEAHRRRAEEAWLERDALERKAATTTALLERTQLALQAADAEAAHRHRGPDETGPLRAEVHQLRTALKEQQRDASALEALVAGLREEAQEARAALAAAQADARETARLAAAREAAPLREVELIQRQLEAANRELQEQAQKSRQTEVEATRLRESLQERLQERLRGLEVEAQQLRGDLEQERQAVASLRQGDVSLELKERVKYYEAEYALLEGETERERVNHAREVRALEEALAVKTREMRAAEERVERAAEAERAERERAAEAERERERLTERVAEAERERERLAERAAELAREAPSGSLQQEMAEVMKLAQRNELKYESQIRALEQEAADLLLQLRLAEQQHDERVATLEREKRRLADERDAADRERRRLGDEREAAERDLYAAEERLREMHTKTRLGFLEEDLEKLELMKLKQVNEAKLRMLTLEHETLQAEFSAKLEYYEKQLAALQEDGSKVRGVEALREQLAQAVADREEMARKARVAADESEAHRWEASQAQREASLLREMVKELLLLEEELRAEIRSAKRERRAWEAAVESARGESEAHRLLERRYRELLNDKGQLAREVDALTEQLQGVSVRAEGREASQVNLLKSELHFFKAKLYDTSLRANDLAFINQYVLSRIHNSSRIITNNTLKLQAVGVYPAPRDARDRVTFKAVALMVLALVRLRRRGARRAKRDAQVEDLQDEIHRARLVLR